MFGTIDILFEETTVDKCLGNLKTFSKDFREEDLSTYHNVKKNIFQVKY